ncbi:hypothetical protein AYL99_01431 [Fonsecaea erecta]|uniref:Isochorismatase-like domain-containing protein n=1 Tax=Fonsecaea erecta TaxID=1367422 RepID=A0A179A0A3_9EURO|nr:hypothetical protein AYL99_01431 [Fonsecaea erecta]OAP65459.1 hypothetical protein AYL99_01431 [Fonsecaea erecta]
MSTQPTGAVNHASRYLSPASEARTALLLIDIQRGLNTRNGYFGTERSTPNFEENVSAILAACREYNETNTTGSLGSVTGDTISKNTAESGGQNALSDPNATNHPSKPRPRAIEIIHVYHKSRNPLSPLHVSGTTHKDGIMFMPCAEPAAAAAVANEYVLSKSTNTAFGNPELKTILEHGHIEQLVVVGIATDHCVTTSVRWAKDLGVVRGVEADASCGYSGTQTEQEEGEGEEKPEDGKIVILSDATACFNKGGFDAETVHKVHLASLEGEFAKVMTTGDVLDQLFG